jgi:allophanate hydrolase subunit 1
MQDIIKLKKIQDVVKSIEPLGVRYLPDEITINELISGVKTINKYIFI